MNSTRGVIYVAFGDKHRQQARGSIESLRCCGNTDPILVCSDRPYEFSGDSTGIFAESLHHFGSMWSRYHKTMIHRLSPWDCTLFLDADTLVLTQLDELWRVLESQPLAMASDAIPTIRERLVWARRQGDVEETKHIADLDAGYFNTGVIAWRRDSGIEKLFDLWHEKWLTYKADDQFLLHAAMHELNIHPFRLPDGYNSGRDCRNRRSPKYTRFSECRTAGVKILHYYSRPKTLWREFEWDEEPGITPMHMTGNPIRATPETEPVSELARYYRQAKQDLTDFNQLLVSLYKPEHNSFGCFHLGMTGRSPLPNLRPWIEDQEHGLAHGLLTAFWGLRTTRGFEHTAETEKALISCLLHDAYRCLKGEKAHDARLVDLFPYLERECYCHSAPAEKDASHPLIAGDRIELLRFDKTDWLKPELLPCDMNDGYVRFFFRHIRPALAALIAGYDQLWIRHGKESDDLIDRSSGWVGRSEWILRDPGRRYERSGEFFPSMYWAIEKDRWSAEVGQLTSADENLNKVIWSRNLFSERNKIPVGLLRMDEYKRLIPNWSASPARDHWAFRGAVPLRDWIFITDDSLGHEDVLTQSRGFVPLEIVPDLVGVVGKMVAMLRVCREA